MAIERDRDAQSEVLVLSSLQKTCASMQAEITNKYFAIPLIPNKWQIVCLGVVWQSKPVQRAFETGHGHEIINSV